MNNDLISREALREAFHKRIYYFDKSSWDEANALIDNAPTIELDESVIQEVLNKRCMTAVANEYLIALHGQGDWVRKVDVIQSIAKQYSEHGELVPMWLNIGDMRGEEHV